MKSLVVLIIVAFMLSICECDWTLVWNDEFNDNVFDKNKWIAENGQICPEQQLNCNTNRTDNLRLIDGALAITAIPEKYLNKNFTSATIATKQSFAFGRYEIRAALPSGKLLNSAIYMEPENKQGRYATNSQIDIMTNDNNKLIGNAIYYNEAPYYFGVEYETNSDINQFHTYALEWNDREIKWFFDDINYYTFNISRKLGDFYDRAGQPFDSPFHLVLRLSVGGGVIAESANQTLTIEETNEWKCSLLIIDYVRVYRWVNETSSLGNSVVDKVSTINICNTIMPTLRGETHVQKLSALERRFANLERRLINIENRLSNKENTFINFQTRIANVEKKVL